MQGQVSAAQCLCRDIKVCVEFADALLCHDDELEGRRIAFILYLVPSWDRSLGGTLDLYSVDGKTNVCSSTPVATSEFSQAMSVCLRGDGSH